MMEPLGTRPASPGTSLATPPLGPIPTVPVLTRSTGAEDGLKPKPSAIQRGSETSPPRTRLSPAELSLEPPAARPKPALESEESRPLLSSEVPQKLQRGSVGAMLMQILLNKTPESMASSAVAQPERRPGLDEVHDAIQLLIKQHRGIKPPGFFSGAKTKHEFKLAVDRMEMQIKLLVSTSSMRTSEGNFVLDPNEIENVDVGYAIAKAAVSLARLESPPGRINFNLDLRERRDLIEPYAVGLADLLASEPKVTVDAALNLGGIYGGGQQILGKLAECRLGSLTVSGGMLSKWDMEPLYESGVTELTIGPSHPTHQWLSSLDQSMVKSLTLRNLVEKDLDGMAMERLTSFAFVDCKAMTRLGIADLQKALSRAGELRSLSLEGCLFKDSPQLLEALTEGLGAPEDLVRNSLRSLNLARSRGLAFASLLRLLNSSYCPMAIDLTDCQWADGSTREQNAALIQLAAERNIQLIGMQAAA